MATSVTTISIKDASGAAKSLNVIDVSGIGTGPFVPLRSLIDANGNAYSAGNPIVVSDASAAQETTQALVLAQAKPVSGFTAITVPGRGWGINITTAGWLTVTSTDNTTVEKYLPSIGNWEFSETVKNVVASTTNTPAAVFNGVYGRK